MIPFTGVTINFHRLLTTARHKANFPLFPLFLFSVRLFGGLVNDVKHRYKSYWSDFKDGFNMQCLASMFFMFFACITPVVTFGGLMGVKTDGFMVSIMSWVNGVTSPIQWIFLVQ